MSSGRVAASPGLRKPSVPASLLIGTSAARPGVELAELLRATGAKGLNSVEAMAGAVEAFSGAMVESSSVGPKSKPKLKLVSKAVPGALAADSSVTYRKSVVDGQSV